MKILALDFETFYSSRDYTLKKLTTEAYVRDKRFAPIAMGYCAMGYRNSPESGWVPASRIHDFLRDIGCSNTIVLCHHAAFDGLILSHHYDVHPAKFLCTMSMARAWYPDEPASLASIAAKFELPSKTVPYDRMDGVHPHAMSDELIKLCGQGAAHDCSITYLIFEKMLEDGFPLSELPIIDLTVKMFTDPQFIGDAQKLKSLHDKELFEQECMLAEMQVSAKELRSNESLSKLLNEQGIAVEYKDGKAGEIPCFAATDDFMKGLQEDGNPKVRALAEMRLRVKSNIKETRSSRLAAMAERGPLPVYLNYFGATRTGRWSGGDAVNWQNFPRSGELGQCIRAPDGETLIIADAAQIECRILNYIAGQKNVLEAFAEGRDIYCEIASDIFGRPITKEDTAERFFGKKTELSCGYGIGAKTLFIRLKGEGVPLDERQAENAVSVYRKRHPAVTRFWRDGDEVLLALYQKKEDRAWAHNFLHASKGYLYLPNGMRLKFNLAWNDTLKSFMHVDSRGRKKMWGGSLTGEVVQALAAVYLREILMRLSNIGLRPLTLRHDEIVYTVFDEDVDYIMMEVGNAFRKPPAWLPGIPLDCEVWSSKNYVKQ